MASDPTAELGPVAIRTLTEAEQIRRRPSMYIGSTDDRGLFFLLLELVHNSIEDWIEGRCKRITVRQCSDGSFSVADDGDGLSIHLFYLMHFFAGAEPRFVEPLSPGALEKRLRRIELHRIGFQAALALSSSFELHLVHAGEFWIAEFHQGVCVRSPQCLGDKHDSFTRIFFTPDPEIFGNTTLDSLTIADRLRELAFLCPGLTIEFCVERPSGEEVEVFHAPAGIADYLRWISRATERIHPVISLHGVDAAGSTFDVALQWTPAGAEEILSFVNTSRTLLGGPHVEGFRYGVYNAFRRYSYRHPMPRMRHIVCGLQAIVSICIPDPQFSGATKERLLNPDVAPFLKQMVRDQLSAYFFANRSDADAIGQHIHSLAAEAD